MKGNRVPTEAGTVGILNVGAGDTKLSFDPTNPAERIRAARIVRDMLRRGYALLIEVDGQMQRAVDFKEDVCEYVIADFDPITAAEAEEQEQETKDGEQGKAEAGTPEGAGAQAAPARRGRRRTVDAGSTRAVAVAPIAGG